MAFTSTIDAAEDALLTLLQADGTLAGLPVELGEPGAQIQREHVFIAEDVSSDDIWDTTGAGQSQRAEAFALKCVVLVKQTGDDWPAVRTRAHALAEAAEAVVAANPTLSGSVFECRVSRFERKGAVDDEGRLCVITLEVACTSYLA